MVVVFARAGGPFERLWDRRDHRLMKLTRCRPAVPGRRACRASHLGGLPCHSRWKCCGAPTSKGGILTFNACDILPFKQGPRESGQRFKGGMGGDGHGGSATLPFLRTRRCSWQRYIKHNQLCTSKASGMPRVMRKPRLSCACKDTHTLTPPLKS